MFDVEGVTLVVTYWAQHAALWAQFDALGKQCRKPFQNLLRCEPDAS